MGQRHQIVPAVLFVLENAQGQILLQLRKNTGFADGLWDCPRGHFEPSEHILTVIRREAEEELGIQVEDEYMHFIGMHHYTRTDTHEGMNFYYKITQWSGEMTNREPDKSERLEWFAPHNFPTNMNPEIYEVLSPKAAHMCIEGKIGQPRLGIITDMQQKA